MKDINVVVVVVISVVSLLTDQFCWLDHGVGGTLGAAKPFERYRRPDQRGRGPPPSIQFNSERRNADIGLFAKSARDEHEHHKLNTKAQTKTKTTKIQ